MKYFSDLPASNAAELTLSGSEDPSHMVTASLSTHTSLREWAVIPWLLLCIKPY